MYQTNFCRKILKFDLLPSSSHKNLMGHIDGGLLKDPCLKLLNTGSRVSMSPHLLTQAPRRTYVANEAKSAVKHIPVCATKMCNDIPSKFGFSAS